MTPRRYPLNVEDARSRRFRLLIFAAVRSLVAAQEAVAKATDRLEHVRQEARQAGISDDLVAAWVEHVRRRLQAEAGR